MPNILNGRRSRGGRAAATILLAVGLVSAAPTGPAAGGTVGNDALVTRVRSELAVFTGWLQANQVSGYVGEVGWPAGTDSAAWNALAARWYADAAAAGLWTTSWATGEWWGCNYKLSTYTWATCQTMDGALSVARPQAVVMESQRSLNMRGVNVNGGEFGAPGSLDATSTFSNATPGVYDRSHHYDVQQSFNYLASRRMTLVRLPVRWERLQPSLGGPLDTAELGRVRAAVARAGAAGLRVIIDVHNYGAYWLWDGTKGVRRPIGSPQVTVGHFANLWRNLSSAFKADPAVVGYDLMNEPVGMVGPRQWEHASQAAMNAIRLNGDTKLVMIPGYNWSGAQQWTTQHPRAWIVDSANNHRYTAHHYFDRDNSGNYLRSYADEVADAARRGYTAAS